MLLVNPQRGRIGCPWNVARDQDIVSRLEVSMRNTAPYGRGSESMLSVYGSIQSRDHRERFSAFFQQWL